MNKILEANVFSDRQFLEEARDVYKDIVRFLRSNRWDFYTGGWYIEYDISEIMSKYRNLFGQKFFLRFTYVCSGKGTFGVDERTKDLYLIFPYITKEEHDKFWEDYNQTFPSKENRIANGKEMTNKFIKETSKNSNHYIHEIIHFFDYARLRGKKTNILGKYHKASDEEYAQQYYNDNLELNAYYQQTMDALSNVSEDEKQSWNNGFNNLVKSVENLGIIKWDKLSDKNKKKYKTRLYNFWVDYVSNNKLEETVKPVNKELTDTKLITSAYEMNEYLKNHKETRFVYDREKDWFLVGNAENSIHVELLNDALIDGVYPPFEWNGNMLPNDNHYEAEGGKVLYNLHPSRFLLFRTSSDELNLMDDYVYDRYRNVYVYKDYCVFDRTGEFKQTSLYKLLGKPVSTDHVELNETVDYIDEVEVLIDPEYNEFRHYMKPNRWYRAIITKDSFAVWDSTESPLLHSIVDAEYDLTNSTHIFIYNNIPYLFDYDLTDEDYAQSMKDDFISLCKDIDNNPVYKKYFPNYSMEKHMIDAYNNGGIYLDESVKDRLNEAFVRDENDHIVYYTKSENIFLQIVKNNFSGVPVRVVYDPKKNLYMFSNANDLIHSQVFSTILENTKIYNDIEDTNPFYRCALFQIIWDKDIDKHTQKDWYNEGYWAQFKNFFVICRNNELTKCSKIPLFYNLHFNSQKYDKLSDRQLNESFIQNEKGDIVYYTSSSNMFLTIVKNKFKGIPVRAYYDFNKKIYVFGDGLKFIHTELLQDMIKYTKIYSTKSWDKTNYNETGEYWPDGFLTMNVLDPYCAMFQVLPDDNFKKYTQGDGYNTGWFTKIDDLIFCCRTHEHSKCRDKVPLFDGLFWTDVGYYEYKKEHNLLEANFNKINWQNNMKALGNVSATIGHNLFAKMMAHTFLILTPKFNYGDDAWFDKQIQDNKPFGIPFLKVEFDFDNKVMKVVGHEGRHRVAAITRLKDGDITDIPVAIIYNKDKYPNIPSPQELQSWKFEAENSNNQYEMKWIRFYNILPLTESVEDEMRLEPTKDDTFYIGGKDFPEEDDCQVFNIIYNNEKVGILAISDIDGGISLDGIKIYKSYRNKGFGTKAINLLKKKYKRIYVRSVPSAKDFWKKQGHQATYNKDSGTYDGDLLYESIEFRDEVVDVSGEEVYKELALIRDDKVVGCISYSVYDDKPYIQMIKVAKDERRKGYATQMVKELQKKFPNTEINFGMTTDDGTKLYNSLPKKVIKNPAYTRKFNRATQLSKWLKDFAKHTDKDDISDEDAEYIRNHTDEWQKNHWEYNDINDWLRTHKKEKVLIKETELNETARGEESFKKWFRNSKIVDDNGNPMICYHGTPVEFNEFDKSKRGIHSKGPGAGVGFWFSTSPEYFKYYKNHMEVYLSIQNPKIFKSGNYTNKELELLWNMYNNEKNTDEKYYIYKLIKGISTRTDAYEHFLLDLYSSNNQLPINQNFYGDLRDIVRLENPEQAYDNYVNKLKSEGYDGIIIVNTSYDATYTNGKKNTQIVAFEPNQIKSIKNGGRWDGSSQNIYEDIRPQYLYHAMWKKQFVYCKKEGKLFGHNSYEYAPNNKRVKGRMLYGISTSRNLDVCVKLKEREIQEMTDEWKSDPKSYFAMKFKDDGTTHYIDKGADLSFVVLVFDYNKLKQNHKIVPYSYVGGTMRDTFGDEQEEIVVGDIPNFMDYVVNVIEYNDNVNRKTLKSKDLVESKIWSDELGKYIDDPNEPKKEEYKGNPLEVAIKIFGTTNNPNECGYILTDGKMLDFSEKKNGGQKGTRNADHRQIMDIGMDMFDFCNIGNIRYMPESNWFMICKLPTEQQFRIMSAISRMYDGEIMIECMKDANDWGNSNKTFEKEYMFHTPFSKIRRDIENYFK